MTFCWYWRRRTTVERWCICHQCVFGYAIPIEIIDDEGGKTKPVCASLGCRFSITITITTMMVPP